MRVCIYGAGAIGGYLAAGLAGVPDVELGLVARGGHLAAMREKGLTVLQKGEARTVAVRATDDPSELGAQDYVIMALKSHQAWEVTDPLQPLLGPNTAVVTCQNGIPWWYFHGLPEPLAGRVLETVDPGGRQWREIGPQRAIGCVVYPATEIKEPGTIEHVYGDRFPIGEPDGTISERCRALSEILVAGGFKAPVLDDVRSEIWLKLWGNLCFNPISALTRATLDIVASHGDTRPIAMAMMREAEAVAHALGSSFRVDLERRIDGAAKVGAHRTSMLQDLERGRTLELDALTGSVQELARLVDVATPVIDTVLGLTRQMGRVAGVYPAFPGENEPSPTA